MATEKEVKAYLNKGNGLDRVISIIQDNIKRNKILATCYGSMNSSDKVQTSTNITARFTELVNDSIDQEQELREIIAKREKTLTNIIKVIDTLDDNEEKEVLLYKYVDGLRFYQIYRKANMSKSKMYRVHDRAIKHLAESWENLGIDI